MTHPSHIVERSALRREHDSNDDLALDAAGVKRGTVDVACASRRARVVSGLRGSMQLLRALTIAVVVLSAATCGQKDSSGASAANMLPDSASALRTALDTLRSLGAVDYVADSLVRDGDSITVWAGPRVWMATDRPTSAIALNRLGRVVRIRHVSGG